MLKHLTLTLLTLQIFNSVHDFQISIPTPVTFTKESAAFTDVGKALFILGRDPKYAKAVYDSAKANDIDPVLWAVVIDTESEYLITAKSSKGYKGLSQTPLAVMKTGFEVGDLTYGTCILREKLQISKGNLLKALTFYKGSKTLYDTRGKETQGFKQAKEVLEKYNKIKEIMRG